MTELKSALGAIKHRTDPTAYISSHIESKYEQLSHSLKLRDRGLNLINNGTTYRGQST